MTAPTNEERLVKAARDFCAASARLTELRRMAARPCEYEDPPEFSKCHLWYVDNDWTKGPIPKSEWCQRCRDFEEHSSEYRALRRSRRAAERRMLYAWRPR